MDVAASVSLIRHLMTDFPCCFCVVNTALTKRKRPTADDDDLGEELSGPWAEDKAESEAKQAKLASAAAAAAKEQEALPVEETYEETEYADNVHMQEPDEEAEKW